MPDRKTVMISSTARDLPEHRKEALDACLRQGMFPVMMEHLPASDAEAISASLAMVDGADIYVGIFAHRYGTVPAGHAISVTEMEYNRAVERKIPRLIFVMDKDHPITIDQVELGEGGIKLEAFKKRLLADSIVNFFKSPADLRAQVIHSLSQQREPDLTAFHYISDIPAPPEAYIAHPYTLLQTRRLVGRQAELNLLTDWVAGKQLPGTSEVPGNSIRILNIVAIGGMGKSALTWKWFSDIAPQEMKPLAGRMWWSFYESDATFENFVIRALAYVTGRAREEVEKNVKPGEREEQLLAALDRAPFLLVLDGLERILIAYARMDAARLDDSQIGNQKSLRKTADPRVGSFLKKLAQVKHSRILVSSRLYPAELETETGDPIPGSFRRDIIGLTDEDAVELWRAFGITGSRDELVSIFAKFDKHPLLIQALAGEVKNYRRAPGNFAEWCKANPSFDPTKCARLQDAMAHVLEYALRGLDDKSRKVLGTIAAFRMPASYDTLAALFVGDGKLLPAELGLDGVLKELEDRGLLGWDRRANRYDLHPIVRGVAWSELDSAARKGVYTGLHDHFESLQVIDADKVNSLEDLTTAIELYNTLIGLGRYDDAYTVFRQRLSQATLYRLSANRQRAETLEMLFPDGLQGLPRLSRPIAQAGALYTMAVSYHLSGRPKQAGAFYSRSKDLYEQQSKMDSLSRSLSNWSGALRLAGVLHRAEVVARRALSIDRMIGHVVREIISLSYLGLDLAVRGETHVSNEALVRALRASTRHQGRLETAVNTDLAQRALWIGEMTLAYQLASRAWQLVEGGHNKRDHIRAARLQGVSILELGDLANAEERLHYSLSNARAVSFVEAELPTLVALAELRRRQGDSQAARGLLDDVWESAERGPYPLFHADACNVLAQIERDARDRAAAVEAATKAYCLAWCDGEPYAYHWGLAAARKHLAELGAAEPVMPPFDESKFEPMPEVEINPDDEFHVDV